MRKKNIPKKQAIPKEIQDEVQRLIDEFNHSELKESTSLLSAFFGKKIKRGYLARFKGKYLYLDRTDRYEPLPICRLAWNGSMDDWDFAIYSLAGPIPRRSAA